ncbi:hypothetical protein KZZ52_12330 [Dactylosporangium sp. AC04546]|uniref:hypothetical protein n=1 Tax=Dactylosporangium sp. AC04546 TaxID=2862460 RepID=UPI001EDD0609|nr:hypothetical protein [Dactylosporangium sp. AC04546]WVK86127.1 hypothetical protein KZZ52_12330 [Dactylosporangium sp. AC04546]
MPAAAVRFRPGGEPSTVDSEPSFARGRAVAHAVLAWLVALGLAVLPLVAVPAGLLAAGRHVPLSSRP